MDVSHPYAAVVSSVQGEVLVTLAGTAKPLTGRELARHVRRGSQTAVALTLDRLVEQGLVRREQAGRAYLHVLNRQHVAAPVVEMLAGIRAELLRRLRDGLAEWSPAPVHASLFGSAARGDGDTSSDIDVLIVRPRAIDEEDDRWRAQLGGLSASVWEWTGNGASIIELAETELAGLGRRRPPILVDLRRDGIQLAGAPLDELLGSR